MQIDIKGLEEAKITNGVRVILRLGCNVPIKNGEVSNSFRLNCYLPTLKYLSKVGAKTTIIGHVGRNKNDSIKPVYNFLKNEIDITFCEAIDVNESVLEANSQIKEGKFLILENLRANICEEDNSIDFAKSLAKLGDVYVNEAFSASHREHASIVGVPKLLPHFAGIRFMDEIKNLSSALNPKHPFIFILGGIKSKTKIPLIKNFIDKADKLFIYGALAHDFFREKGVEIGKSLYDAEADVSQFLNNTKIVLPTEVIVVSGERKIVKNINNVTPKDIIVDAGPGSLALINKSLKNAKSILWNGPLGSFENGNEDGTNGLAKNLSEFGHLTIAGGGDTVAALSNLGVIESYKFVSTGGGAMLDFLANETLPGIDALK